MQHILHYVYYIRDKQHFVKQNLVSSLNIINICQKKYTGKETVINSSKCYSYENVHCFPIEKNKTLGDAGGSWDLPLLWWPAETCCTLALSLTFSRHVCKH